MISESLCSIVQHLTNKFKRTSSIAAIGSINSWLIKLVPMNNLPCKVSPSFLDYNEMVIKKVKLVHHAVIGTSFGSMHQGRGTHQVSHSLHLIQVITYQPIALLEMGFHPFPQMDSFQMFIHTINWANKDLHFAGLSFFLDKAAIAFVSKVQHGLQSGKSNHHSHSPPFHGVQGEGSTRKDILKLECSYALISFHFLKTHSGELVSQAIDLGLDGFASIAIPKTLDIPLSKI